METILVTGGAGYIGSICVEELLNTGYEVAVFDNLSEGHRAAIDPRATFFQGELADRHAIEKALHDSKATAVMHFAAHALVGESMVNPSKYFHNNVACGHRSKTHCFFFHLRDLWCARSNAHYRIDASTSDQSLRRIKIDVRENIVLVWKNPRHHFCGAALF